MSSYRTVKEIFGSDRKIVGESFYIGSRPETKFGDIFFCHPKGLRFRANILDESEGFIKDPERRSFIENALSNTELGNPIRVSLSGGITTKNSQENDVGRPGIPAFGENGSFTLEMQPGAYNIQCDGNWESLKSIERIVNDLGKKEKLNTMIKDIDTPYFMVTEIFKTSSQFNSLISSAQNNVKVNISASNPVGFYGQLSQQINNSCPDSFTYISTPTIPFVRGVRVRPLWEIEGTLQDKPPPPENEATRKGTPRKPKPLPQPDNMKLEKATLPEEFFKDEDIRAE